MRGIPCTKAGYTHMERRRGWRKVETLRNASHCSNMDAEAKQS